MKHQVVTGTMVSDMEVSGKYDK